MSSAGRVMAMPALLTTMSTGPSACSTWVNAASTLSGWVTSMPATQAWPPCARISVARVSPSSVRRPHSATRAPASASRSAKWRPSPL
ncbi:hypothetical protein CNMCM8686_008591 [Aspergillus fumigatus]|nr:hypothetical protein CNMCM8686_008591 [Aspergillus fumigatus]